MHATKNLFSFIYHVFLAMASGIPGFGSPLSFRRTEINIKELLKKILALSVLPN